MSYRFGLLAVVVLLLVAGSSLAQTETHPPITRQNATALSQLAALQIETGTLDAAVFIPSDAGTGSGLLATAGADGVIRLVDPATGQIETELRGHTDSVTRVVASSDGALLVSGGRDQRVIVWDVTSQTPRYGLQPHTSAVTALALSADGQLLGSGSQDGSIVLHSVGTGEELARLENYGGPVRDIAFSPDRTRLAAASEDGTIWLWGLAGEPYVSVLVGHVGPATALTFSPDGSRILSAGWDGTLRLWDAADARQLMTIQAAEAPLTDVIYHPAGTLYAAAGADGWLRVWRSDTASGTPLAARRGFGSALNALAFDPTGSIIATTGTDGILGLWVTTEAAAPATPMPQPSPTVAVPAQPSPQPTFPLSTPIPPTQIPLPQPTQPAIPQVRAPAEPQLVSPSIYMPTVNTVSGIRVFPLVPPTWEIDPWEPLVGQFQGTGWLTEESNIVLGGHSQLPDGRPGIFAGLYGLSVGDPIVVQTGTGQQREFRVEEIFSVPFTDVSVVMPNGTTQLTLITCDVPSFDPGEQIYWERLVVIARPVPA